MSVTKKLEHLSSGGRGNAAPFRIHIFMYGNRAVMTAHARQIDGHGLVSRHPHYAHGKFP